MRAFLVLSLLALGSALIVKEDPAVDEQDAEKFQIKTEISKEDENNAILNGKPVFYQIVMGSFPNRKQYKLWMTSLREVGQYDGTVVIVTDKPGCLENGLGEKLLGGKMEYSDSNVNIYPGTGNGKVHILKVKTARSLRGIKMQKSKVWDNLELAKIDHPVSSAIYTDTDVVIGKSLKSFMAYEQDLEKKQYTLALFPEQGTASWEGAGEVMQKKREQGAAAVKAIVNPTPTNVVGAMVAGNGKTTGPVHTGVVVMFPTERSRMCLKDWAFHVGGGKNDPAPINDFKHGQGKSLLQTESEVTSTGIDQAALNKAASCKEQGNGIHKMETSYFLLADEKALQIGRPAQFVHITNTGSGKDIARSIKSTYFHKWLKMGDDVEDFDSHGQCDLKLWANAEYMERNKITDPKKIASINPALVKKILKK